MWYEYDDEAIYENEIDYDEVREDLIWLQRLVDDVMGEDKVTVFLATKDATGYEVAFESDDLGGPVFEYDVESLKMEIQRTFPDYDWKKFE